MGGVPRSGVTGPGNGAGPRESTDTPANPYLDDLIKQCSGRGLSDGRTRRAVLRGLDDIISDYYLLFQTTGYKTDWFDMILHDYTRWMTKDGPCPPFLEGPGPGIRHLFLLVLMGCRSGPVQDGLGIIFGVDRDTAAEYLEYGRSICSGVDTPANIARRLIEGIEFASYYEVEEEAPGYDLTAIFGRVPPRQWYGPGDLYGIPCGVLGGEYNELTIYTGTGAVLGSWAEPVDGSTGAEVFRRYVTGAGRHLLDLTRQMPYGDRWSVRYRRGLEGIEGMLPEADIWPTYRRSKDWALKAPRKRRAAGRG